MSNRDFVSAEQQVEDQQTEINDLQAQIDDLTSEVEQLKEQLQSVEAEKIAAEELASEYRDALDDIQTTASRALN